MAYQTHHFSFSLIYWLIFMFFGDVKVRDFIHKALYDPNVGYFSQKSASVGVLDSSIKFNRFEGNWGLFYFTAMT